ncbi:MAG: N-acetylmuramoyl-L-alanine amidase [Alphaproteobacteria bacterium]|nr:N-acetylmuramoyl-L-alanine amidase [Alphaproteobacteria bacterium]
MAFSKYGLSVGCFLLITACTRCKEIGKVEVTLRHLDNGKCVAINLITGKKAVFLDRKEDEQNIKGIVIHYSECLDADVTKEVFYSRAVSSHYDVDFDGEIFEFVDPKYIAFHAGKSAWNGDTYLNRYFIGIEQDMWGYYKKVREKEYDYEKFGQPVQLPGDNLKWFKFSDKQVESTGRLIFALQQKYKIPGRFVVTHSDVAIERKSDPGPMFPYKEIFEKYGAGYYPKCKEINLDKFSKLTDSDYVKLLEIYGYGKGENGRAFDLTDNQIVKAFKLHFYPGDLSRDLNDNTKKMILNLVASYYNYKDLITNSLDEEFRRDMDSFLSENKERTKALSEFIAE